MLGSKERPFLPRLSRAMERLSKTLAGLMRTMDGDKSGVIENDGDYRREINDQGK